MVKTHIETLANGKKVKLIAINNTYYHALTDARIIKILEEAREKHTRIKLDYGDVKTGKSWGDTFDIVGRIGRSTGKIKIPLLVYNNRSMGGGAILDNCIIKISYANKKEGGVLYQHHNYSAK